MFPGGNMKQLMKKAQKMQKDLLKAQEEMENKIFNASSGGGMVKIEMNGKYEVKSINIDPEVIDPDDVEMLEDLILAALKDGFEQVSKNNESSMSDVTGGMKIPGLF